MVGVEEMRDGEERRESTEIISEKRK